jgi:RNA polymerase sigma-70 factor (ECF subfamily)
VGLATEKPAPGGRISKGTPEAAAFERELLSLMPAVRVFARGVCRNPNSSEDLAQQTLLKALCARDKFSAGTNMKAWLFRILRNQFLSERRRAWRFVELEPGSAEETLVAVDDPYAALALNEARLAMDALPKAQREALSLIGVGGLSYGDAAELCGCRVGTMKSRVSRGRSSLQATLISGRIVRDGRPAGFAMGAILSDLSRIKARAPAPRQQPVRVAA